MEVEKKRFSTFCYQIQMTSSRRFKIICILCDCFFLFVETLIHIQWTKFAIWIAGHQSFCNHSYFEMEVELTNRNCCIFFFLFWPWIEHSILKWKLFLLLLIFRYLWKFLKLFITRYIMQNSVQFVHINIIFFIWRFTWNNFV